MTFTENSLQLTWCNSAWIPHLNVGNILDYFSDRSNPFYDHSCNNEIIRMQRLNLEHLNSMTGIEYILLHAQEPILYVVRKQHRFAVDRVKPLSDYYIISGVVHQAPDLASVVNARLVGATHYLESAFEEAQSFSRYHPSRGYWWEFKDKADNERMREQEKLKSRKKEEVGSLFQRQRVDVLLEELASRFPPRQPVALMQDKVEVVEVKQEEVRTGVKRERDDANSVTSHHSGARPPPEKKLRSVR